MNPIAVLPAAGLILVVAGPLAVLSATEILKIGSVCAGHGIKMESKLPQSIPLGAERHV